MSKPSSKLNEPDRFELFILGEGEEKLTVVEDTKIPNAATITINKEDHTLANMLRSQLLLLPYVTFAGYKVPHPLEPLCVLKIQTTGQFTPVQALQEACGDLMNALLKMKQVFASEVQLAKTRDGDEGGEAGMEGGW